MADSSLTKQALAHGLKVLLKDRPFSRVSVSDICNACGMSRKSFYYHFQDKYDLLNWIFTTEFVDSMPPCNSEDNWQLLNQLCRYFYDNRNFYRRAFAVQGQNSFSSCFWDFLRKTLSRELDHVFNHDPNLPFYTDFYVDALGCAISRWIQQKEPIPAEQFCRLIQNCIIGVAANTKQSFTNTD